MDDALAKLWATKITCIRAYYIEIVIQLYYFSY